MSDALPRGVRPQAPGPGQESVWDYPRPPRLERTPRRIRVAVRRADGSELLVADTTDAFRVLETSHPPTYYLPAAAIAAGVLAPAAGSSWCEWKGRARYVDVVDPVDGTVLAAAAGWLYDEPTPPYGELAGAVAFYPGRVGAATVDGEVARPQPGGFYGGWVTDDIAGPVKGAPGSNGW